MADDRRLADAEQFVRQATSHFDQPALDDATVTAVARKICKAMRFLDRSLATPSPARTTERGEPNG
jgi:hypothetical protein